MSINTNGLRQYVTHIIRKNNFEAQKITMHSDEIGRYR